MAGFEPTASCTPSPWPKTHQLDASLSIASSSESGGGIPSSLQTLSISSVVRRGRRGKEIRRVPFGFVQIGELPRRLIWRQSLFSRCWTISLRIMAIIASGTTKWSLGVWTTEPRMSISARLSQRRRSRSAIWEATKPVRLYLQQRPRFPLSPQQAPSPRDRLLHSSIG